MPSILIVGSGASGVHFALSVLKKGHAVTMLDVGFRGPESVNPEDGFVELKSKLNDPVEYFLGRRYESVIHPGTKNEYYGFPPNKSFIFSKPDSFRVESHGFAPLVSFSRGGLAEAWTGGVYALNDYELDEFPFDYRDVEPYYTEVARRIGISGARDDLTRFYPWHQHIRDPLRLDEHSRELLKRYEQRKGHINNKLRCYVGRSRVATLSEDYRERKSCAYLGRCLWGCPIGALYTPSLTLEACRRYSNFHYESNIYANYFRYDSGRVTSMVGESVSNGSQREFQADRFVLAAGTLSSSKIFMDSLLRNSGEQVELTGLMDNRQILIPFLSLRRMGRRYDRDTYQYHQIALGIESERPEEYVHGQLTTLKTALVHPIIQGIPFGLRAGISIFRNLRAALGVVNVNLHDRRRNSNSLKLTPAERGMHSKLVVNYSPVPDEDVRIYSAIRTVKKLLWSLGAVVPPGMLHVRPMGASVHYAGTIPMTTDKAPRTATVNCRSNDFDNLYFVDGTTFPFLPAKNLTFTLMANAVRVAENEF